jgi:acetolactate synthase regulatory subunit
MPVLPVCYLGPGGIAARNRTRCLAMSYNQVATSAGETGMEISIQSGDELEQLRSRLRKMTDAQLVSFGKAARSLCRDPKCPEVFKRQLAEARAEWQRRHP